MASNKNVSFQTTVNGSGNTVNNAGENIYISQTNTVRTESEVVSELIKLLSETFKDKGEEKKLIEESGNQLLAEVNKPKDERNVDKIKNVLGTLGKYISLAGTALVQADKVKYLFEQALKFFS